MIHESWFQYDNFRFFKLLYIEQFQFGICLAYSRVKTHEEMSFHICVFKLFFQQHIHKKNIFSTNLDPMNLLWGW
jgi:hypothetical protein